MKHHTLGYDNHQAEDTRHFTSRAIGFLSFPFFCDARMGPLYLYALLLATFFTNNAQAYIPAYPTNDTQAATAAGIDFDEESVLHVQWFQEGMLLVPVSYQIPGQGSVGHTEGAFVHFIDSPGADATSTPWVALVSCDSNTTDTSLEQDVFSHAHSKGAVGVVLYSLYSTTCIISPDYQRFPDHPIDVYVSYKDSVSRLIEATFLNLKDQSLAIYDSKKLTDSASLVKQSLNSGAPREPGPLIAWLIAHNATWDLSYTSGDTIWQTRYTELPTSTSSSSPSQVTGVPVTAQGSTSNSAHATTFHRAPLVM
ncbi:hypothetical protein VNI00_009981 [Paramarasmius palmivorus]|uniref:Uncharacterized protein n=1 Tax=Paramarasmius palmivorus TaxID=297713 RepID=A0AAW0CPP9_9AGAR